MFVIVYIAFIPLAMILNKIAYKRVDSDIHPWLWIMPVFNIMVVFVLAIGIAIAVMPPANILSKAYWKNKWDQTL